MEKINQNKLIIKKYWCQTKKFAKTNYKRLQKAFVYIKNDLRDSDGGTYLTVDSFIYVNNIITGSDNIALRKVNVKPYGFDKM